MTWKTPVATLGLPLLILAAGILLARPPVPAGSSAIRAALVNAYQMLPKPMAEFCAAIGKLSLAPPDTPDASLYSDTPELLMLVARQLLRREAFDEAEEILAPLTGSPDRLRAGPVGLVVHDPPAPGRVLV